MTPDERGPVPRERAFGPYLVEVDDNHATIRRDDCLPCEPSWYELWAMSHMAFGAQATAVEVYPPARELVDGAHQRHLWRVEHDTVPTLTDICATHATMSPFATKEQVMRGLLRMLFSGKNEPFVDVKGDLLSILGLPADWKFNSASVTGGLEPKP